MEKVMHWNTRPTTVRRCQFHNVPNNCKRRASSDLLAMFVPIVAMDAVAVIPPPEASRKKLMKSAHTNHFDRLRLGETQRQRSAMLGS